MLKRSRTGAYAPPHFYAVNHRQMILVRGCYNTILMCRQGTLRQMPQVLSIGQNKIVFQRSQPLRSKAAYYAAKSSSDDFRLRLLLHKQKRSRTGAYAPPHFYAVNHRQMILVRGCYSIKLSGCQATVAVRHCFARQNKTAPTKADAVSVIMILSDLSDNLNFGKHTLWQCLYRNARTGRL